MPPLHGTRQPQASQELPKAGTHHDNGEGLHGHDDHHSSRPLGSLDTGAAASSGTGQHGLNTSQQNGFGSSQRGGPNLMEEKMSRRTSDPHQRKVAPSVEQFQQMLDKIQELTNRAEEAAERASKGSRGSYQSCNEEGETAAHQPHQTAAAASARQSVPILPLSAANLRAQNSRSQSPQAYQKPSTGPPQQSAQPNAATNEVGLWLLTHDIPPKTSEFHLSNCDGLAIGDVLSGNYIYAPPPGQPKAKQNHEPCHRQYDHTGIAHPDRCSA